MSKPNRPPFRELTREQQIASLGGSARAKIEKEKVYEEMKRKREQEQQEKRA